MKLNPRVLAAFWAAYGLFGLAIGGLVAAWFGGFAVLVSVVPDTQSGQPAPVWMSGGLGLVAALAALFACVGMLPGLVTAWGLWKDRSWARPIALVAAVLILPTGLPWMLLGIATLAYLLDADRKARPASAAVGSGQAAAGGLPDRPAAEAASVAPKALIPAVREPT